MDEVESLFAGSHCRRNHPFHRKRTHPFLDCTHLDEVHETVTEIGIAVQQ